MPETGRAVYDTIGATYASGRQADPRWQRHIDDALGPGRRVVNVGAGTGSYEPVNKAVVGVEPSVTMIGQRPDSSAPVVCAAAENLPFPDNAFDTAMAILTVHHWAEVTAGIAELRRVSRRQLVLTFDPHFTEQFWLSDYIPEVAQFDLGRTPSVDQLASLLDAREIRTILVPHDMSDGVLLANWRRPDAYLDPAVRACCSGLAQIEQGAVDRGIGKLKAHLEDGTWTRRYGELLARSDYDGGYRLIIADRDATARR